MSRIDAMTAVGPYARQFADSIDVRRSRREPIPVWKLSDAATPWMNGATFHGGMELLHEQVQREASMIRPDLFVGINHGGLMTAVYLEGRMYGKNRQPIGIVKTNVYTGEKKRGVLYRSLPKNLRRGRSNTILVVDCQIKSGRSSQQIIADIETALEDYEPRVYYALLVACGVRIQDAPRSMTMAQLFSRKYNDFCKARLRHLPDFLAYVSRASVKPPFGLP